MKTGTRINLMGKSLCVFKKGHESSKRFHKGTIVLNETFGKFEICTDAVSFHNVQIN